MEKARNKVDKNRRSFTHVESKVLLELISKYKTVIENKSTDSSSCDEKNKAWMSIAAEFNAAGMVPREAGTLLNRWKLLKKNARKSVGAERREMLATGGGIAEPTPKFLPDSLLQIVNGIVSSTSTKGNENPYDSNADIYHENDNHINMKQEATTSKSCEEIFDVAMGEDNVEEVECETVALEESCVREEVKNSPFGPQWTSYSPSMLRKPSSNALRGTQKRQKNNFSSYKANLVTKERVLDLQQKYYSKMIEREAIKQAQDEEYHQKRLQTEELRAQKEKELIAQNNAKFRLEQALLQAKINRFVQEKPNP